MSNNFQSGKAERFQIFARQKFKRQHAHADKVAAMDALEAFGQHRANAEQNRSFGGPVARGARAIFFSGDHDQRDAFCRDISWPRRRWTFFRRSG